MDSNTTNDHLVEEEDGESTGKIKRIDVLKVEYGKRKLCECSNPHYEIDYVNKIVQCEDCGAIVEPFEALYNMAKHYERLGDQVEALLEQRREIAAYKPHLIVIKNLEREARAGMIPYCPKCGKTFELDEISAWHNRKF